MPIIEIEMIVDQEIEPAMLKKISQRLADGLGEIFSSPPAATWVRLRSLPRWQYAENNSPLPPDLQPVFVDVLKSAELAPALLRDEAFQIATTVASILDRPKENVHIIYQPAALGRIAFGGKLRDA